MSPSHCGSARRARTKGLSYLHRHRFEAAAFRAQLRMFWPKGARAGVEACGFEPYDTKHNERATVEACGFQPHDIGTKFRMGFSPGRCRDSSRTKSARNSLKKLFPTRLKPGASTQVQNLHTRVQTRFPN